MISLPPKQWWWSSSLILILLTIILIAAEHTSRVIALPIKTTITTTTDFTPTQVHLAFTNSTHPNALVISFHTKNYNKEWLGMPIVKYSAMDSTLSHHYEQSAESSVFQYGNTQVTGYDFHVWIPNLKFSTKYYYQCTFSQMQNISSEIYNFYTKTDPKQAQHEVHTVIMYGDQGTTNSKNVIARTTEYIHSYFGNKENNNNLFVYHLGDISYADDFAGVQYQPIWNQYMDMMANIMPYVPYMVCVGNHENGPQNKPYDDFERGFMAYNHRFFMPGRNSSLIGHNMWHSFENGLVTFVAIDTETNFPHSFFPQFNFQNKIDQLEWLSDTLSKIDRKKTPWVVVVGHRPIYSSQYIFSAANGSIIGESKILQQAFEDILYKYQVDIAMFGHVHSYERTNPVYRTQVEPGTANSNHFHNLRYTIHIVNGAGGNTEGLTPGKDFYLGQSWASKIFYQDEGYGILKSRFDSNLNVYSLEFNYYAAKTNELVDSFTVTKNA
ncbi:hypothetical protein C9374_012712 [Naegleria lovaniensis]|uniref:Purple acid phosphatase n=1 Tax=Naegleria lovaniensis TaxID=51637 RepID=A0AA88H086_NAELO|nr:uncharacterized protein C9374_012712 [Naegleria lovaniensis]KAG2392460.1 hypothetical protein C9374_012712 [Naegleria lovaniensis]